MIKIIQETKEYYHAAEECIQKSFWNVYMPGCEEHYLLHKLRESNDFIKELSLLALDDFNVVGAIYGSIALYNQKKILTFGPLGVDPAYQHQKIGSLLVNTFIDFAKKTNYPAIVITGVPTYYPQFGFKSCLELGITIDDGVQFPALMGLELKKDFFLNNPGVFKESDVFFNLDRSEVEKYNGLFPTLKKEILPGQWKK